MTSTTLTPTEPSEARAGALPRLARPDTTRPVAVDVVRSEWTKLRTVRSTYWTFAATIGAMLGLGALLAFVFANRYSGMSVIEKATFNPTSVSLSGVLFAQLAIGVLGVLAITSEYGTGMIRTTFAAVPNRRLVLAAKAVVFGTVAAIVGIVTSFGAFFVGQAILSGSAPTAALGDPGVLRSIIGAGLYLAVLGIFAVGLGVLIRKTAGAIATFVGFVLVLPIVVAAFGTAANGVAKFLPSEAGQAIFHTAMRGQTSLSPWTGFGVLVLWAVAALGAGAFMITHRDA